MDKYAYINQIRYIPTRFMRQTDRQRSIQVLGVDTEADRQGQCFMIATSLADVFHIWDFPSCFFTRTYRGSNMVAYNLKYDAGAFLQVLDRDSLTILQQEGEVQADGYTYTVIANKCLSVRRGKNTLHIFDLANFYKMKLEKAAAKFLGKHKLDINPELFTQDYIEANWDDIAKYCVNDAVLCAELAELLISKFEAFGVYPKKLYSVAYVSFQYFTAKCPWIHVKRYWKNYKHLLDYAMRSYNGGKFEVTQKGPGYFYEYDIVSAYPFEISNLIDIRTARIERGKAYRKSARYGFINCKIKIPFRCNSPLALKNRQVNYYPIGEYQKVITKAEYDFLLESGCDITILDAYWLMISNPQYPYRQAVRELMKYKTLFKAQDRKMDYETVKIFLNSFYGKFVQLIAKEDHIRAGSSWNPIYGSIITSNCRIRVSRLQQQYSSVVAVHTDSIISTEKLDIKESTQLGDIAPQIEGQGLILGSGIYQVGEKTKFRGFQTKIPLLELLPAKGKLLNIKKVRPRTWREVIHSKLALNQINRFEEISRDLHLNFDNKRIWLDDYNDYSEVTKRSVESVPWLVNDTDF